MWRSVTDECQAAWRSIFDRPAANVSKGDTQAERIKPKSRGLVNSGW